MRRVLTVPPSFMIRTGGGDGRGGKGWGLACGIGDVGAASTGVGAALPGGVKGIVPDLYNGHADRHFTMHRNEDER